MTQYTTFDNRQDWLQKRTEVLTATELSIILGLNPFETISALVEGKKTQLVEEMTDNAYMWIGRYLEPVVIAGTNEVLNTHFVQNDGKFYYNDELRIGATPDAFQGDELLECKTTKPYNFIKYSTYPPDYYIGQVYMQMLCTDTHKCLLSIMSTDLSQETPILELPIVVWEVVRSKELDDIILGEIARFWKAFDEGKNFRRTTKFTNKLKVKLMFNIRKIYGD